MGLDVYIQTSKTGWALHALKLPVTMEPLGMGSFHKAHPNPCGTAFHQASNNTDPSGRQRCGRTWPRDVNRELGHNRLKPFTTVAEISADNTLTLGIPHVDLET